MARLKVSVEGKEPAVGVLQKHRVVLCADSKDSCGGSVMVGLQDTRARGLDIYKVFIAVFSNIVSLFDLFLNCLYIAF